MPARSNCNCNYCAKLDKLDKSRRYAWVQYYKMIADTLNQVKEDDFRVSAFFRRFINNYVNEMHKKNEEEAKCSICLELYLNESKDPLAITSCAHIFHFKCISSCSTSRGCPLCRTPLKINQL